MKGRERVWKVLGKKAILATNKKLFSSKDYQGEKVTIFSLKLMLSCKLQSCFLSAHYALHFSIPDNNNK